MTSQETSSEPHGSVEVEGEEWDADVKDMRCEAEAIINDVMFAVRSMRLSRRLPNADHVAYLNIETKEGARYCVQLSDTGLKIVAYSFDEVNEMLETKCHETIYSLLDSVSPAYRQAFGTALLHRLEALQQQQQEVDL
uniref:Gsk3b interacting protein n=1 Tax=Eptatretus burgeri TaxID=7764 RepID=A0A8C4QPA5_EPTBU